MRVRFRSTYAGPLGCYSVGDVVELEEAFARILALAGTVECLPPLLDEIQVAVVKQEKEVADARKKRITYVGLK